jgi:hypothetical protein
MSFEKIVIFIALFILIIMLISVAYAMYKTKYKTAFPPVDSDCPDYWESKSGKCVNVNKIGSCNIGSGNSMDFNTNDYKGHSGLCNKLKWAKQCKVSWNGVTNAGSTLEQICNKY